MDHFTLEPELSANQGILRSPKDFHWLKKSVPCQHACPAGTNVPSYLEAIAANDFTGAYRINLKDNVFPAVLGRICTRPCELACRHGEEGLGEPVAICFSKRSAADFSTSDEIQQLSAIFPPSGKKVAVIGSGPSGLAAARDLCLLGHSVTVYEQYSQPGGMLIQNIPPFRLPKEIVLREIEQIARQGVKILCNTQVGGDTPFSSLYNEYDALIAAGGCTRPNVPAVPGVESRGVLHGPDYLRRLMEGERRMTGKSVIVIGGGFTAVDSARAALRDGAESVRIYYRRRKEDMTITPGEFEALDQEGISIECLASPLEFISTEGRISALRFVRNRTISGPENGKAAIREVEGSGFEVAADTVLLATGQTADMSWLEKSIDDTVSSTQGRLDTSNLPQTSCDKLFIAGDQGHGSSTVIDAVASGKECARAVDRYLTGQKRVETVLAIDGGRQQARDFSCNEIPRQEHHWLPVDRRDFASEVELGLEHAPSVEEARRCYVCNYNYEIDTSRCIFCDLCCEVKPRENCILKVSGIQSDNEQRIDGYHFPENSFSPDNQFVYRINPAACIRCNRCLEVCPVDCITVNKVRVQYSAVETERS